MGWASGSILMSDVIKAIKTKVPVENRTDIYVVLIEAFEDHDWDTQSECMRIDAAFDRAMGIVHPTWYDKDGNPK